jgi:uncharacterized protein DUF3179
LVPDIDGKLHHFTNVGLYNGLFVMQDSETKTLWNHLTGEALYGPLVGRNLGPVGNLLQMNVKQALAMDPKVRIAISDRIYFAGGRQFGTAGGPPNGGTRAHGPDVNAQMGGRFIGTLGKEDPRRPRMELGLGVWTDQTHRYYPMARIREHGGAFVDQLDGRKVLIFVNSETNTPAALFVHASSAKMQDDVVRLDNGAVVRDGVLFDRAGKRQAIERPHQVFSRWYGFALTFPGCEVFGG